MNTGPTAFSAEGESPPAGTANRSGRVTSVSDLLLVGCDFADAGRRGASLVCLTPFALRVVVVPSGFLIWYTSVTCKFVYCVPRRVEHTTDPSDGVWTSATRQVFKLTLMDPAAFFLEGDLTAFSASGSAGGTIRRSQTRQ